jgi:hypothetical protein
MLCIKKFVPVALEIHTALVKQVIGLALPAEMI